MLLQESDRVRLSLLEQDVKALRRDVQAQTRATHDLIDAWNSARGFIALVHIAVKVVIGLGVLWAAAKGIKSWFLH